MFRKLWCDHEDQYLKLVDVGTWCPTFHTTNGLEDEDERTLIFKCRNCMKKRVKRTQIKTRGKYLLNYPHIL